MKCARSIAAAVLMSVCIGCTEPGETTGIGAAAGGVMGAGLGAIIGNQTGDAGSGLVIGALAGAGAGAAVGNALQAQDEAIRSQDEAIERQDRIVQAQRNEISELRRMNQDTVRFRSHPNYEYLPDSRSAAALRANPSSASSARQEPAAHTVLPSAAEAYRPAPVTIERGRSLQRSAELSESSIPVAAAPIEREPIVESDAVPAAVPEAVPARAAAPIPATTECRDAESEYTQAQAVADAPQRLFHLRRALRLCPDMPQYHAGLAEVYLSLGRREDAHYEYSEALKLDPANPDLRAKVDGLKSDTY